jgi:hypothetical protein
VFCRGRWHESHIGADEAPPRAGIEPSVRRLGSLERNMRILAWPNQVLFGGLFESIITPWPYAGFSPKDLVKSLTLRNGITNQICRVMAGFTDPGIDRRVRAGLMISALPAQTFVSSSEMMS